MGCRIVRTFPGSNITGTFTQTGLTIAGKVTTVTVTDAAWTALPVTALSNRNQLNIQNRSGANIVIDYINTNPGYVGLELENDTERQYAITDSIIIYAKAEPLAGSVSILVEELS